MFQSPVPRSKYFTNGQKLLNETLGRGQEFTPKGRLSASKKPREDGSLQRAVPKRSMPPLLPESTYASVTRKGNSFGMQGSFDRRRDESVGKVARQGAVIVSGKLGRKSSQPLSALNSNSLSRKTPVRQPEERDKSLTPKNRVGSTVAIGKLGAGGPLALPQVVVAELEVIDVDKRPELLAERFGHLVKSKNVPAKRLVDYLVIVVKGLHYSIKCLKPPTLKFIQSKKIKLADTPLSTPRSPRRRQRKNPLPGPRRDHRLPGERRRAGGL